MGRMEEEGEAEGTAEEGSVWLELERAAPRE